MWITFQFGLGRLSDLPGWVALGVDGFDGFCGLCGWGFVGFVGGILWVLRVHEFGSAMSFSVHGAKTSVPAPWGCLVGVCFDTSGTLGFIRTVCFRFFVGLI